MRILPLTPEYFENQLKIFETYNNKYKTMIEIPNACLDKEHKVMFFEEKRLNNLRRGVEYTIFKQDKCVATFEFLTGQAASWFKRTRIGNSQLANKIAASHSMVSKDYQRKGLATFFHELYLHNGYILVVNEQSQANIGLWDSLKKSFFFNVFTFCPIEEKIFTYGQETKYPRFSLNVACSWVTYRQFLTIYKV